MRTIAQVGKDTFIKISKYTTDEASLESFFFPGSHPLFLSRRCNDSSLLALIPVVNVSTPRSCPVLDKCWDEILSFAWKTELYE